MVHKQMDADKIKTQRKRESHWFKPLNANIYLSDELLCVFLGSAGLYSFHLRAAIIGEGTGTFGEELRRNPGDNDEGPRESTN